MTEPRVAGLLLAAGGGRRYGMPKALVELDGRLFVESSAAVLRDGGCAPVIVVLGARADEVRAKADPEQVHRRRQSTVDDRHGFVVAGGRVRVAG